MSTAETARLASFAAFWPYYIGEHRNPTCRRLHFVGTTLFVGVAATCLVQRPVVFGGALVAALLLIAVGARLESRRNAAPVLLLAIGLLAVAHPLLLAGIVCAYAFAWVAHFKVEHNRPATFTYPLWSLAGDFRMWGEMLRGRLWTGDGSEIAGPA